MKYLDEYRDPELASPLIEGIRKISQRSWRIMEICGTHTVSIFRHGIRDVLPSTISLISGPGCPVCVTAQVDIDRCIKLARIPGVIVTTFGDLMRVPGSGSVLRNIPVIGDVTLLSRGQLVVLSWSQDPGVTGPHPMILVQNRYVYGGN